MVMHPAASSVPFKFPSNHFSEHQAYMAGLLRGRKQNKKNVTNGPNGRYSWRYGEWVRVTGVLSLLRYKSDSPFVLNHLVDISLFIEGCFSPPSLTWSC